MNNKAETFNPFDPTGMLKSIRDDNMASWSKMMIQLVNTEAYAQATAVMLDAWLSSSAPFRKAIETATVQTLVNLNMPTRADVLSIADRLTNIEMRLDDMEAKLNVNHRAAGGAASPQRSNAPENQS